MSVHNNGHQQGFVQDLLSTSGLVAGWAAIYLPPCAGRIAHWFGTQQGVFIILSMLQHVKYLCAGFQLTICMYMDSDKEGGVFFLYIFYYY